MRLCEYLLLIEIKIANHKVENIFNTDKVTLFKYNCGI